MFKFFFDKERTNSESSFDMGISANNILAKDAMILLLILSELIISCFKKVYISFCYGIFISEDSKEKT